MKTVWRFLKELKVELPDNPEIPLLRCVSESICQRDIWSLILIIQLFTIDKIIHRDIDEWIENM
jgi:hypothetical protein